MNKIKKHKMITLKLQGDKITAENLRYSIGAFYGFIDEIATEVSGKRKPIRWIVRVRKGSIVFINEPEIMEELSPKITDEIFESVQGGIDSLEKNATRPAHFSDKALEYLQDLASISSKARKNGLEGISVTVDRKPHKLTAHVIANVDFILGVYSKALGSIEGRLS